MNGVRKPSRRRRSSSDSQEGPSQWILTSFNAFDKKLDEMKVDVKSIKDDIEKLNQRVGGIEKHIDRVVTAAWAVGITLTVVVSVLMFVFSFVELPTFTLSISPSPVVK